MPPISTYNAIFGQHLIDNQIYPNDGYITKPQNWNEILGVMEQPRVSPVLPGSDDVGFQAFEQAAAEVFNKLEIIQLPYRSSRIDPRS